MEIENACPRSDAWSYSCFEICGTAATRIPDLKKQMIRSKINRMKEKTVRRLLECCCKDKVLKSCAQP